MELRKWKTNSVELRDKWREAGLEIDEEKYSINDNSALTPCKVLGLAWDSDLDVFQFGTRSLEKFLSKTNCCNFINGPKQAVLQFQDNSFQFAFYLRQLTPRLADTMSQKRKNDPNNCEICYFRDSTPRCNMDNHVVAQIKDNLMHCVFCDGFFRDKRAFAKHMHKVHFPDVISVEFEKEE
ncbi:uncharacterized protein LOC129959188 [Argiope bruennichi]|uniref:uncharacterized protein LOC129959188 n=1 Tax=Argiope bruennichi TaxID=94029 RepID=UPI002494F836|nr:uncharacterized protein LOC129959188 [Argiope bruennichi]